MSNEEQDSGVAYLNPEESAAPPPVAAVAEATIPAARSRGSGPARTLLLGSSEHPESPRWLTHAAAALEFAHGHGVPGVLKLMDHGPGADFRRACRVARDGPLFAGRGGL